MPRKRDKRSLIKQLDKIFSQYIRWKYADSEGLVSCYTCEQVLPVKSIQNGHFISRKHYATRWDEDNCRPQCPGCNVFRYGEQYQFGKNLEEELGEEAVEEMRQRARGTSGFEREDYERMIAEYKEKLEEVCGE